ncbi:MAG: hypothetical protein DI571_11980 [Arsenicicoccus sp.]|nr:MAG: hypothetical protein DI571_11980 [Arsenicicoccus sp.]
MPAVTPSRRDLLRGGAWAGACAVLAGCSGERLRTPWSPDPSAEAREARENPDLELLQQARDRVERYRLLLARTSPTGGRRREAEELDELWQLQAGRLDLVTTALRGEAEATASPDTSAATGDDAASSSGRPLDLLDVGRQVRDDLPSVLDGIGRSTPVHRPMLLALAAQHLASAERLGAATDWPALVGPVGTAAVPVLATTRPAVFALEVLRSVTRSLTTLAGDAAPVPPLGYDLPEPLADATERRALARAVVQDIAPSVLRVGDRAGADTEQVEAYLRLVMQATLWGAQLGTPEVAFPGMTLP